MHPPEKALRGIARQSFDEAVELHQPFGLLECMSELGDVPTDSLEIDFVGVQKQKPFDMGAISTSPGHGLVDDEILGHRHRNAYRTQRDRPGAFDGLTLECQVRETDLHGGARRLVSEEEDLVLARKAEEVVDPPTDPVAGKCLHQGIDLEIRCPYRRMNIHGLPRHSPSDHRDPTDDHEGGLRLFERRRKRLQCFEERSVGRLCHGPRPCLLP